MGAILTEEWGTGDCQLWFIASEPAVAWARGENTMADNSDSPNTGTETETETVSSSDTSCVVWIELIDTFFVLP